MGEGGSMLVIQKIWKSALARVRLLFAEVAGGGMAADALSFNNTPGW